jgi:cytochrome d ubiquinol oxidase subunit I
VEHVLPTYLGVSSVSLAAIIGSLTGFVLFYSTLAVVDVVLMVRAIRHGPVGAPPATLEAALRPLPAGDD